MRDESEDRRSTNCSHCGSELPRSSPADSPRCHYCGQPIDPPRPVNQVGAAGSGWLDLFCVVMLVGSLATEVYTVGMFSHAVAATSWPTTEGTILTSTMVRKPDGLKEAFEAEIRYRYSVEGVQFESSTVRSRGTASEYQFDVDAVLEKFPVGERVPVYFDPASPRRSYLEVGVDWINYVLIVSPLFFAWITGYYLHARRQFKRGR
jgi:hypothetical protein